MSVDVRTPFDGESLEDYIADHSEFFSARELLTMKRARVTVPEPDRRMWPNIVPTLYIADKIRKTLDHPLVVGNGYRPEPYNSRVGGARRSQHLFFRAVDLDLPRGYNSATHQEDFYEIACELYLDLGEEFEIGLGLYRPRRGRRVHIDTGFRQRKWKDQYVDPILEGLR